MAHTYATVAEADDYEKSGGAAAFASQAASIVALKLSILESVSRRIDSVCHRSQYGSGFGPRIGTNYYDGMAVNALLLNDDLLSLTSLTVAPQTGGTPVTLTVTTDYFLSNVNGYTGPPWRQLLLTGTGAIQSFAGSVWPGIYGVTAYRTIAVAGTYGYANVTIPTGTTVASGLSVGTTATTFTTSATPLISPGMTLLIDSEQVYLYALSGTTATIVRGVNGTTAATHADSSTIARYQYDARVHEVCLRLYLRRLKARDAGADGTSGGLDVPGQTTLEGEDTIIRRGLSDLLLLGTY
jgi:hypothetical protein